jgi:hypothetical protein
MGIKNFTLITKWGNLPLELAPIQMLIVNVLANDFDLLQKMVLAILSDVRYIFLRSVGASPVFFLGNHRL